MDLKYKKIKRGGSNMVSGINTENSNILQLFLSAIGQGSAANSTNGLSQSAIESIGSKNSPENGFLNCLQENFDSIDADSDDQLSLSEIDDYMKNNPPPMGPPPGLFIENMNSQNQTENTGTNSNSTDSLSSSTNSNPFEKTFDELDTNKDGKVSQEELEAALSSFDKAADSGQSGSSSSVIDAFASIFEKLNSSGSTNNFIDQILKQVNSYANSHTENTKITSGLNIAV